MLLEIVAGFYIIFAKGDLSKIENTVRRGHDFFTLEVFYIMSLSKTGREKPLSQQTRGAKIATTGARHRGWGEASATHLSEDRWFCKGSHHGGVLPLFIAVRNFLSIFGLVKECFS